MKIGCLPARTRIPVMHEMSLCEDVMRLIEDQARNRGFSRVLTVRLEIGELAGVEKEAMRFSFPSAAKDTLAEGCRFEIIDIPGRAACPACKHEVRIASRFDECPDCGHYPLDILAGEEMRIRELEVK